MGAGRGAHASLSLSGYPTSKVTFHLARPAQQSEIRVTVDGNIVRFGHQPHPDREAQDEKEQVGGGGVGNGNRAAFALLPCSVQSERPHAAHGRRPQGIFHRAERVSSFRGRALRMPETADCERVVAKVGHAGVYPTHLQSP